MPNTLVHVAVQGPVSRLVWKDTGLQWVAIGCILPDLPWIIQRVLFLLPEIDRLLLRCYVTVQASLLFCLILSAAISLFTRTPARIFCLLGANSALHLLLDATQIKWANGIHFFIPITYNSIRFDWFWPEHPLTYLLTLAGLLILLFSWRKNAARGLQLAVPGWIKGAVGTFLLAAYLLTPPLLINGLIEADYLYINTLLQAVDRPGRPVEFDRGVYHYGDKKIRIFTGEHLQLQGNLPPASGESEDKISLQGTFVSPAVIEVAHYHIHNSYRDRASYLGLFLLLLLTLHSFYHDLRHQAQPPKGDVT
ncbi:MAG: hypothetical protein ABFS19_13945 [Thermodesulfobacteriota bacterium]